MHTAIALNRLLIARSAPMVLALRVPAVRVRALRHSRFLRVTVAHDFDVAALRILAAALVLPAIYDLCALLDSAEIPVIFVSELAPADRGRLLVHVDELGRVLAARVARNEAAREALTLALLAALVVI